MNATLKAKLMNSLDYRAFLSLALAEEGKVRGYKKNVAATMGCQPAYLSQVLQRKVHLTPEQGEKLCVFWDLSDLESEYFFHLLILGRAGTDSLQERLKKKLSQLRKQWQKKEKTFDQPSLQEMDRAFFYYSHWLHSAIHVLLTVPSLQNSNALAGHLKLGEKEIKKALSYLEKIGLVVKAGNSWKVTQANIHSPEETLSAEMHHRNWRLQSLAKGAKDGPRSTRYTSVHSLSVSDFEKIRDQLQETMLASRKVIADSPEEMGACLIIDYFPLLD